MTAGCVADYLCGGYLVAHGHADFRQALVNAAKAAAMYQLYNIAILAAAQIGYSAGCAGLDVLAFTAADGDAQLRGKSRLLPQLNQ